MDKYLTRKFCRLVFWGALLSLAGCATPSTSTQDFCPSGSDVSNAGKSYVMTDLGRGYLSLYKEKWPWSSSDLKDLKDSELSLTLVCIEPNQPQKGLKQRPVVYSVSQGASLRYVFGTSSGKIPQGVVENSLVEDAKKLIGRNIWTLGNRRPDIVTTLENLKPYKVVRVQTAKSVVDISNIYLVIVVDQREVRMPYAGVDEDHKLPNVFVFDQAPTAQSLGVSQYEYELIRSARVEVGMSQSALYFSIGYPPASNRTRTAAREREQLVYRDQYVYVENGKVVAVQD